MYGKARNVVSPTDFDLVEGVSESLDADHKDPAASHRLADLLWSSGLANTAQLPQDLINEMLHCLIDLRNCMLRELVQDLSPKFFASKEFEFLLWEFGEYREVHKDSELLEGNSPHGDGNVLFSSSSMRPPSRGMSGDADGSSVGSFDNDSIRDGLGVVPDGAVQRLLRKVTLPTTLTMHRAPLDILDEMKLIAETQSGMDSLHEPLAWIAPFDTVFFEAISSPDTSSFNSSKKNDPKLQLGDVVPVFSDRRGDSLEDSRTSSSQTPKRPQDKNRGKADSSAVPSSIIDFIVPSGRIVWENTDLVTYGNQITTISTPAPKLFNFVMSGGGPDNAMLYAAAYVCFRRLHSDEHDKWENSSRAAALFGMPGPSKALTPHFVSTPAGQQSPFPSADGGASGVGGGDNRAPSTTSVAGATSALSIKANLAVSGKPADSGDGSASPAVAGNWKDSLLQIKDKTSPFFEKFKGITPPALFKAPPPGGALPPVVSPSPLVSSFSPPAPPPTATTTTAAAAAAPAAALTPSNTSSSLQHESAAVSAAADKPLEPVALGRFYDNEPAAEGAKTSFDSPMEAAGDGKASVSSSPAVPPRRLATCGYCIVSKTPSVDGIRSALHSICAETPLRGSDSGERLWNSPAAITPQPGGSVEALSPASVLLKGLESDSVFDGIKKCSSRIDSSVPAMFRSGGATDFDADSIVLNINPRNLVAVYVAFLLEHKIAVISSKLTALTCLGELMREAIAPLKWNHVFVPVLPKKMSVQILECPTPFFVGIQRDFFDARSVPSDVCILDLDHDACRMSPDLMKALKAGRRLVRAVEYTTRRNFTTCDSVTATAFAAIQRPSGQNGLSDKLYGGASVSGEVIKLFRAFSNELVLGLKECCMYCIDHDEVIVLFDELMFSAFKKRRSVHSLMCAEESFLQQLIRTQAFSVAVTAVILRQLNPSSRPPSRTSSPFIMIRKMSINAQQATSSDSAFPANTTFAT
jgi:hypothetical protein